MIRRLIDVVVRLFFRRLEVTGREHVPRTGPVIFILNHPNALMDPLVLINQAGRPVSFLAKEPLFRMPVLGSMVKAMDAIPVHRKMDQADTANNAKTFEAARRRRKKLTSVTKSNAQVYGMGLWDDVFNAVRKDYADVESNSLLVDAAGARVLEIASSDPESLLLWSDAQIVLAAAAPAAAADLRVHDRDLLAERGAQEVDDVGVAVGPGGDRRGAAGIRLALVVEHSLDDSGLTGRVLQCKRRLQAVARQVVAVARVAGEDRRPTAVVAEGVDPRDAVAAEVEQA